jgi:hypothetical protein
MRRTHRNSKSFQAMATLRAEHPNCSTQQLRNALLKLCRKDEALLRDMIQDAVDFVKADLYDVYARESREIPAILKKLN